MATVDHAAIVRDLYKSWNAKDLDRVAAHAAPDARVTVMPFGTKTSYREHEEGWARAFPDGQIEIVNLVAQGEWVITEFTGRGTQTGALRTPQGELPPTGRHVELSVVECLRFRNGKITEGRMYFDAAGMMAQLGVTATATATQARPTASPPQARH
jgi:predicted ester cyclase